MLHLSGLCNPPNWLEYPNLSYAAAARFESGDAGATDCQTVCTQNLGCNGVVYNDAGECYLSFDPTAVGSTDSTASFYNIGRVCATSTFSMYFKTCAQPNVNY